ncbi:MAG: hypothetical protein WCR36_12365, partial [Bacteroidaceae bacterium]
AVDGIATSGEKYQVKAKMGERNFLFSTSKLDSKSFDYLVIIYFDKIYNPTKVIRIPSNKIKENQIRITASNIDHYEDVSLSKLSIPPAHKQSITSFAIAYNQLVEAGIIRSRRIVGDIGEFYACSKLNLNISDSCNEKGYDASHTNGMTFEIKTRRVYNSERRISETRRLNNLIGKSADYLVVVTLDRVFNCSGMWLIPMENIENKKSANLYIVNKTPGTLNVVPSKISYLKTGNKFISFEDLASITKSHKSSSSKKYPSQEFSNEDYFEIDCVNSIKNRGFSTNQLETRKKTLWDKIIASVLKYDDTGGCVTIVMLIVLLMYILGLII